MKIEEYSRCLLPTRYGEFDVRVYRTDGDPNQESLAISMGGSAGFEANEDVFVRVHSECFTGEVLGSLKCDCEAQLDLAQRIIAERKRGVVVYLRQEGRGIGLGNKIRAYAEQEKGADTIEANHILGFPSDMRDFRAAALILGDLGVQRLDLNTNNPDKITALEDSGLIVNAIIPSRTPTNEFNEAYLQTKADQLGHLNLDEENQRLIELSPRAPVSSDKFFR